MKVDLRQAAAWMVTATGTVVLLVLGYKLGQRTAPAAAAPQALPPPSSGTGAVLTQSGETELEQDALKAAIDAAILG